MWLVRFHYSFPLFHQSSSSSPHPQIKRRQQPVKAATGSVEENQSNCPCLMSCTIFLSYTSNLISCGIRESIRYLAEHKMVQPSPNTLDILYVPVLLTNFSFFISFFIFLQNRTLHLFPNTIYFFLCVGGCLSDHSWRNRGGSDQVFGPRLRGRIFSARQRSV